MYPIRLFRENGSNKITFSMERIRLVLANHSLFKQAWELYQHSFPEEERRMLDAQAAIMNDVRYHFEVILNETQFLGILLWWKFEKLRFIEHLAVVPQQRGNGYGRQVLKHFIRESSNQIFLEVEKPEDEIKQRRIKFYQSIGFKLNFHPHQQPPYQKGGNPVELLLMTYPAAITEKEVTYFHEYCQLKIHFNVLKK